MNHRDPWRNAYWIGLLAFMGTFLYLVGAPWWGVALYSGAVAIEAGALWVNLKRSKANGRNQAG